MIRASSNGGLIFVAGRDQQVRSHSSGSGMTDSCIVAMLATRGRERLLLQRALPSVLRQSRTADKVVVIGDGEPEQLAARIHAMGAAVLFMQNQRSPGLAGALNSGLDHLLSSTDRPEQIFVAFLDDDDAWLPMHLEAIERCIRIGAETVATPFLRIETNQRPRTISPPSCLTASAFHRGNPGLQGSNLVARLDLLLEAGAFNEALLSCTDRDLGTRLSRRPGLRHLTTDVPSVLHYACEDRPRLSARGSETKRRGLTMFDAIHSAHMDAGDREAHLDRARRLFDWHPSAEEAPSPLCLPGDSWAGETPPLVIGIVADPGRRASLERLLFDIADAVGNENLPPPDVLLLENGECRPGCEPLPELLTEFAGRLRIQMVDTEALRHLVAHGEWSPIGIRAEGRYAIADARTVLQACLYHMARDVPGSVIWILDDDMRLDAIFSAGDRLERRAIDIGDMIVRAQATGADIAIGAYTGAAPLPAVATVRVQLVDLLWNLRRLSRCPPDVPVPIAESRNAALRAHRRDYYYDLSRFETDRLEMPFALEAVHPEETCSEALTRLGDVIPRLLAGDAPLRPLVVDPEETAAFRIGDALHRGGNTFVFDPEALADLPNLAPTVGKRPTRRSDMIWSLLQRSRLRRRVISVPVPVRHDRTDLPAPDRLDHAGIADDVRGFAMFRALSEVGLDAPEQVEALCIKSETERLASLRLSFFRIRGLARELAAWAKSEAPSYAPTERLARQARTLLNMFSNTEFAAIRKEVNAFDRDDMQRFLREVEEHIPKHRNRVRSASEIPRLLWELRLDTARRAIAAQVHEESCLQVLGAGKEGVSVTDGHSVWKLFDRWTPKQANRAVPVLHRLLTQVRESDALPVPRALTRTPVGWLLELPFEESQPYEGGFGPGMVELLADLHRHGVHCRNLHPDNLRVVEERVRLIVWGADLVDHHDPAAEGEGFLNMCRRAWLCWRFAWRNDLKELMRGALGDPDLPELSGCEGLQRAVRERLGVLQPIDPMVDHALALRPSTVLDYGAGKGKQAKQLAEIGAQTVVWDPNPEVADRLDQLTQYGVRRAGTAEEAIAAGPFDVVFCRRVACLLDDAALDILLRDLRKAVCEGGRVLLGICHPAYVNRVMTAEAEPVATPCDCGTTHWKKRLRGTGRILNEVHRSERLLRRRLIRAGLRIVGRYERLCTEFERFETVSDLLIFELVPAALPQVGLLVKACAMDAHTLEEQVRALLNALEGPSGFAEVVLTLDRRTSGFPRAHVPGDLSLLRTAAERLRAAGEVDRIVEVPEDAEALRALNRRWFGLDLPATHTATGAATAAFLTGFDSCKTRYVLHADADMMVGRPDRDRDPITELLNALEADPEALSAAFPVARSASLPWSARGPLGPWRVESRLGIVDRSRMETILPLPNEVKDAAPGLSWHRAMDCIVASGAGTSLRGGDRRAFCVHPPNFRKQALEEWAEVREAMARGRVSTSQIARINWTDEIAAWRRPERHERFIFVICGRDVPPERFRRCWESVIRQSHHDWGAVVIDDASTPEIAEEIGHIVAPQFARVTWITRHRRVGLLANTVHAIRHLCADPNQIVVTLDADDHLIGSNVLDRLDSLYRAGADLTVGSMLRTDKTTDYPVSFTNPRQCRGGNIWQHLRSFRKYLFDSVPDGCLRLDGKYVRLATDWAFMLPMVENARNPVWIREKLYLHEPGEQRHASRAEERERVIARLVQHSASCGSAA